MMVKRSCSLFVCCYAALFTVYLLCRFFLGLADYGAGCFVALLVSGMVTADNFVRRARRPPDNEESGRLIRRCLLWSYVVTALLLAVSEWVQYGFQYIVELIILFTITAVIPFCSFLYIVLALLVLYFCFGWFAKKDYSCLFGGKNG